MDFIPQYKAFMWLQKELQKSDILHVLKSCQESQRGADENNRLWRYVKTVILIVFSNISANFFSIEASK